MKRVIHKGAVNHTVSILLVLGFIAATFSHGLSALADAPIPTFTLKGQTSEFASLQNSGSVTPTVGPAGTVVVRGGGVASLPPVNGSTGMRFQNSGQQNTDTAFLEFKNIPDVLNVAAGEISFSLTSKLSQANRTASNQKFRYAFDVNDDSGKRAFAFVTNKYDTRIYFEGYVLGAKAFEYYLPAGQEEAMFGVDKTLSLKIAWSGNSYKLIVNGSTAQSGTLSPQSLQLSASSSLVVGAAGPAGANAGFFASDDVISNFIVSKNTNETFTTTTTGGGSSGGGPVTNGNGGGVPAVAPSGNGITITDKSGSASTNYPIQIGRPFTQGEIKNAPIAVLNNTALYTQADIKSKWPDGSVKFAIVSFILPSLPANSSATVSFSNQTKNSNTPPTQTELLDAKYDFDASMTMANGRYTLVSSARNMLEKGKYTFWTQGAIASTIILADHSAAREFDVGFDSDRSFRPIFIATFWHTINKVTVRYIGEISNMEHMKDVSYDLVLKLGKQNPVEVYKKLGVIHHPAQRWTKKFTIGGEPGKIAINHNLPYLEETKLIPAYDTTRGYSDSVLQSAYTNWTSKARDVLDSGGITKYMPQASGREDLGMYPAWVVRAFYTYDPRSTEEMFGNADLGASFPMQYREGKSDRMFDKGSQTNAIGRVVSTTARPTIFFQLPNLSGAQDKITYTGSATDSGLTPDLAHQPELYSVPYMLSGDFWYLEQLQFWAGFGAGWNSYTGDQPYGRGPDGTYGGMHDQPRADAWGFRTRMLASVWSPDGTAEKNYFTRLTNDALAVWEGERNITGTGFQNTDAWKWGKNIGVKNFAGSQVPALNNWSVGSDRAVTSGGLDPTTTASAAAPWEQYFILSSLGRAEELGFQSGSLKNWVGQFLVNQVTDSGYDRNLVALYQMPTLNKAGQWFPSLSAVKSALPQSLVSGSKANFDENTHGPDGYAYYARGSATFLRDLATYNTLNSMIATPYAFNTDLKWDLVPRPAYPTRVASTAESGGVPSGGYTGTTTTGGSTSGSTGGGTTGGSTTGGSTTGGSTGSATSTSSGQSGTTTPVTEQQQSQGGSILPSMLPTAHQPLIMNSANYITGMLVKDISDGAIYMIRGKYKQGFASASAFLGQGYKWDQVVSGDTSGYALDFVITNKNAAHPWGSWIKNGKAIYYVYETGLIGVPSWDVFMQHTGGGATVANMNAADKLRLKKQGKNIPVLSFPDNRVYN